MIEVSVRKDEIKLIGHANSDIKGRDIVCAAVSMIAQNLVTSVRDLTNDEISYMKESGKMIIRLDFKNLSEQSKILVDSFFLGICVISNEYPKNVKIV